MWGVVINGGLPNRARAVGAIVVRQGTPVDLCRRRGHYFEFTLSHVALHPADCRPIRITLHATQLGSKAVIVAVICL